MRKYIGLLLPALTAVIGGLMVFPGCLKDHINGTYQIATPVYELKSTVLANINGDPATPISLTGQIYVKGSYIYLNDVNKGIHIIDNSDPSHPSPVAFLNIPGNLNIAIRNNVLYADMFGDVLSLDITDAHHARLLGVLRNFFSNRIYGPDSNYVIARWMIKDTTISGSPQQNFFFPIPHTTYYTDPGLAGLAAAEYSTASSAAGGSGTGTAGSTAVMALVGDYLYAIPEEHSLGVVHIADSTNPVCNWFNMAGYDLETLFPIRDKLLLGSKEGVYVYSISNPAQPVKVGEFTHGTACDPVIANSNYAYVTLHSGTYCGGAANELDILDATDLSNATAIKSYPMTSPTGLCLDGSLLFVCDASVVKVFDATDPENLRLLSSPDVSQPSDVLAFNHLLLVVATDGLHEFDYSDPSHVMALSFLPITTLKP